MFWRVYFEVVSKSSQSWISYSTFSESRVTSKKKTISKCCIEFNGDFFTDILCLLFP